MDMLFEIRLENGARYRVRSPETLGVKLKDWVVVRKDFYLDYGQLVMQCGEAASEDDKDKLPRVQRVATPNDQSKAHENDVRSNTALRTAQKFVEKLNLPMKLLNAHFSFDAKLVTVQFTADGRVDFRELVKELSHALSSRIELRQIGVRDETAIYGGIGVCGRALCCCSFIREFSSINVKMAKEQDLSLTPTTISGVCGRLKCCLKYEHDGYLELEKGMPRRGDGCECPEGHGRVIDRNLLTRKVTIQLEGGGNNIICPCEEVKVCSSRSNDGDGHSSRRSGHHGRRGMEETTIGIDLKKLED